MHFAHLKVLCNVVFVLTFDELSAGIEVTHYKAITVDDLDVSEGRVLTGRKSQIQCSQGCMAIGTDCLAFHFSREGHCIVFLQAGQKYNEQNVENITLWIHRNGIDPDCNPSSFPLSRGRSRYAYFSDRKYWEEANDFCLEKNAKLLQITSDAERHFVWDNFIPKSERIDNCTSNVATACSWVGLRKVLDLNPDQNSDDATKGWQWEPSQRSFTNQNFWKQGEPQGIAGDFFVAYCHYDGYLVDREDTAFSYICECMIM